ncbi:hypothetical protein BCR32DRAFT_326681 [Anaeromyces robustus]|uniref:Uncharacterized protein n=1 Tax=Anaeromyces robustus TaxID=1754192 RepID=A0A1Y1XBU1_9FUNG|nr:hypothetical protein BCR32DRAFT_326681 [Anaeromyces robustus]|eukprot:ORX82834.1 hypothetical protein BCR32DRAFT_326681 [Anaeromyces robustus]
MKKTGSCFKNKTPIDASKLFNSMNNKKKDEMKVNNNEKTSILSNNTLDLNALPHLPNITSQQQQPYLKQKLTQQQSSNQTQLSYQLSKQTQNKQQESQKQILQINIENDQSFFKNHESKAVYNGINNLYSDSGGKTLSKNIESSTKNLQNTLENPKLPMVNDLDPTPLKSSSQKVKTSAITSSINFNDVFSVSGNNKLTPLSMVNANKKINYLMELENLKSEESNPINNLPHTHPVRPFLKPIKLAGDLPFNNDLQPIGEIPLKKTPLSLENIHSSSKTPLHFVQPQISNKQIIPDFNNKNLPPIPNKLSKIQNESPLPILRKTKK